MVMSDYQKAPFERCGKEEARHQMPWRLLVITVATVFLCEIFIMYILSAWPEVNSWGRALIDSTVLIVLLTPFLFFFLFRPMSRNICTRKKAESELLQYQTDLQRLVNERTMQLENAKRIAEISNQAKSDFFANVSHELRTPLNAILGFSNIMLNINGNGLTERQKEYLHDINESGRRLLSMITKIIDMGELESGKKHLVIDKMQVDDLISGAVAFIEEDARNKQISLSVTMQQKIGAIYADKRKLDQVMANLLSNAVKFTPRHGSIKINTVKVSSGVTEHPGGGSPEYLEITVGDTGTGIRPEDIPKVFRPFQQIGPLYKKEHIGSGVGLALCKYIIEAHEGAIWVESEEGKGSKFVFSLPVR